MKTLQILRKKVHKGVAQPNRCGTSLQFFNRYWFAGGRNLTDMGAELSIQLRDMGKSWAGAAEEAHEIFSNLVWAHLIGHAGIALINQFASKQPLSDMWSMIKD